jgi:alkylation response protein AidB-like acyl-CoA dehydrogenase
MRILMAEEEFRKNLQEWIRNNAPSSLAGKRILFDTVELDNYEELMTWQRKLYEAGYLGITWPKEYGGQGLDPIYETIAYEEFIRAGLPYGRSLGSIGLMVVGPAILYHGSEEQKRKYIPRILRAEDIWCQGFSEPSAGSDLASIKTRAEEKGEYYVINGEKIWSSYAHLANYMILLARTSEDKYRGLTMFIVDMKQEGIKAIPIQQITGKSEFSSVYLQNVIVPKSNIIGNIGDGWKVAMSVLNHERFTVGITLLFSAKISLEYLKERAKIKGISLNTEELEDKIESLYSFYERLLNKLRKGDVIESESAILKLVASELLQSIYELAILNFDLNEIMNEKWYIGMLSSRGRTIAAGTSEILRNLIGERILKLPK